MKTRTVIISIIIAFLIGLCGGTYIGFLENKELTEYQKTQWDKQNMCENTHRTCILIAVPVLTKGVSRE